MEKSEIIIGTKVNYYPIISENTGQKFGKTETVITSEAWELGDGTIVCKVEGVSGGVAINHLEKRENE